MNKTHTRLSVQNSLAQDCLIAGVFEDINAELKNLLKTSKIKPKPLMVCSGGTSTRCAAQGHWTLDLRKYYQNIDFDVVNNTVEIGAGVNMSSLLKVLAKHGRSFPTGLSGLPGLGYILTGGISPLSRSQGLAIDQVLEITGVWGNGEPFNISKPTKASTSESRLTWRGLCGAAPFLGIITNIKLKTQPLRKLKVWQAFLQKEQLIEFIQKAESWPNNISLQWIWGDQIKIYGVLLPDSNQKNALFEDIQKEFPISESLQISEVLGLQEIPEFSLKSSNKQHQYKIYSEVVGLLGPSWGDNCNELIKSLADLISRRPNKDCYIASQQLGGASSQIKPISTSFIHRHAIWKPWINAAWQAGNHLERQRSLNWLQEVWKRLEPECPGIHLAQMHQHLPWHQKETKSAFEGWLPGLKELKHRYDPQGILPRL